MILLQVLYTYSRMSTSHHISGDPWNRLHVGREHRELQDSSSPRQPEGTPEISHPSPMPSKSVLMLYMGRYCDGARKGLR